MFSADVKHDSVSPYHFDYFCYQILLVLFWWLSQYEDVCCHISIWIPIPKMTSSHYHMIANWGQYEMATTFKITFLYEIVELGFRLHWNLYPKVQLTIIQHYSDSKVHGANMGPTWVLSAPGGPHVGPINLAIRVVQIMDWCQIGNMPLSEPMKA